MDNSWINKALPLIFISWCLCVCVCRLFLLVCCLSLFLILLTRFLDKLNFLLLLRWNINQCFVVYCPQPCAMAQCVLVCQNRSVSEYSTHVAREQQQHESLSVCRGDTLYTDLAEEWMSESEKSDSGTEATELASKWDPIYVCILYLFMYGPLKTWAREHMYARIPSQPFLSLGIISMVAKNRIATNLIPIFINIRSVCCRHIKFSLLTL